MKRLSGKTAIVTGASRGIGRAIAIELAREGARVAVNYQNNDAKAQEVVNEITKFEGSAILAKANVAVGQEARDMVKRVADQFQHLDILVNNAGITRDNLLLRMKDDEWDAIMATNLKPAYRLAKGVLRGMMKARHGRIIQIGSVVGTSGNPGQTNYASAKAALIGFTKSLAQEVGSRNITVNCVAPGFVDTDMTKALSDAQRTALFEKIPLGRLGTPEDIANAVLFLASPQASYITGATLHVNGGMYMA
jgi:3-oxoacyl-[acyl-carrier protein] reductase